MPSRTILLTGVPSELNNESMLHSYFSKFGSVLWVNEMYERNENIAVITFFSISEAIAAFMSNEPVLENSSIQKSWFEYAKKCELCSYKYSSTESIKQHTEQCHPINAPENVQKCNKTATARRYGIHGNVFFFVISV